MGRPRWCPFLAWRPITHSSWRNPTGLLAKSFVRWVCWHLINSTLKYTLVKARLLPSLCKCGSSDSMVSSIRFLSDKTTLMKSTSNSNAMEATLIQPIPAKPMALSGCLSLKAVWTFSKWRKSSMTGSTTSSSICSKLRPLFSLTQLSHRRFKIVLTFVPSLATTTVCFPWYPMLSGRTTLISRPSWRSNASSKIGTLPWPLSGSRISMAFLLLCLMSTSQSSDFALTYLWIQE